ATARLAMQQNAGLDEAATLLDQFVDRFRDHYRFYEAQLLRGNVAIDQEEYGAADSAFSSVSRSPFPDYQMAAKIGNAKTLLARKDLQGAKSAFDEVAGMTATTPLELSRKLEAMLGQATCLQMQSQYDAAAKILDQVIRESSPGDTQLQAEAYVRQGKCYSAIGENTMQAIMAYLHVDVVPSLAREKEYHAEALYQLSQLWPVVNQPARAAEAAARLEQQYPDNEWTKKLGGQ
ncbi:MAG: tol-pal system YbgF family protein, partial [Maioricimonas sp. JB049]